MTHLYDRPDLVQADATILQPTGRPETQLIQLVIEYYVFGTFASRLIGDEARRVAEGGRGREV